MPDPITFEYAVLRLVPRVEREEFLNVGVIVFCKRGDFLRAKIDVQPERLHAFAPDADETMICNQLNAFTNICEGTPESGYFAKLSKSERFNWLAAPSSTIIQTSKVHSGICNRPLPEILDELFSFFVK